MKFEKLSAAAKFLMCLPVFLLLTAAAPAEQTFRSLFTDHVKAIQSRDLAALERTITNDRILVLILPNGTKTDTRQAYLDFHKAFFASKTWSIRFDPVSEWIGDDFAVITTRSHYSDVDNGKPFTSQNWVTLTFRKEDGDWRLIHDQNTRLP